ncbi:prepilin-type N-terminal cleavage/methylation domain-containing protein [bacterium]|jgi:prepilin-type N-terminal cleavage/methylation domain-containing protein|nr:prepilin-type N-terminal cleavage/methylation domain-containing protein [bacterium]
MNKFIKQAFTLIELLVVIAIIGILSGLIVVSMSGVTQKATIAKAQVFSNSLRNSLMLNLVSEWKLDGNTNDSWSNGNNGAWSGSAGTNTTANWRPPEECVSGGCLDFDGHDDNVAFGSDPELTISNNWTCEHWIKWAEQSNTLIFYAGVGGTTPNFFIRYDRDNFGFRATGGPANYYKFVSSYEYIDRWTHLVWTADTNNNITLYINGRLAITKNISSPDTNSLTLGSVGRSYGGTLHSYKGKVDGMRLYSAAISASQIKEQYFAGLNNLLANEGITSEEYQNRIGELAIR